MRITFTLLVFFSFIISGFSQSAEDYYKQGKQKAEKGKLADAMKLYNKAIELDGSKADYFIMRASVFCGMRKFEEAFADFNKAVSVQPDYQLAYQSRAYFFLNTGQQKDAIADYTKAIEFSENDSTRHINLVNRGSAKMGMRNFQSAYEDYSLVLQKDSNYVDALNNMAMIMDDLGRGDEALPLLYRIVKIDPKFFVAYINIGFKLTLDGKYAESIEYFNKAIELDPNQGTTYNNRGYAKFKLNDYKGALEDINKSLKLFPTNSYAYRNRGLVYMAQGESEKACEDLHTALRYGFTKQYGDEVEKLVKRKCL